MLVNKGQIAKNTIMLYLRMLLVMAVSLYTIRVILKNLGVVDYGIYNVVSGVVSMFGFLNSSMAGATQRFMSFELGLNVKTRLNLVFCHSVFIHVILAFIILILAETLGLWFVYNKFIIPDERFGAAIWVYQFALISFLIQILSVPYHAAIIAHEKMTVYAWIGIVDVAIKLGIAYALNATNSDKLIFYSLMMLCSSIFLFFFYMIYSRSCFEECHFRFICDKSKFREMFFFAGWNMIGNLSFTLRNQGSNILLNMFFGPAVNAARGIAQQVDSAVEQFVTNFQTASNPQIIKSYAKKEFYETEKLVCQCSKYSFFLMVLLGIPVFYQSDYILSIWLAEVPEFTSIFVKLILLSGIIDSLSKVLITYVKATGRVKWYQIVQGGFYMFSLPVIYLFLKLGYSPISSIFILLLFTFFGIFLRLILLHNVANNFSIRKYFVLVLFPAIYVGVVAWGICYFYIVLSPTESLFGLIVNSLVLLLISVFVIWSIGVNKMEKTYLISMMKSFLFRRKM